MHRRQSSIARKTMVIAGTSTRGPKPLSTRSERASIPPMEGDHGVAPGQGANRLYMSTCLELSVMAESDHNQAGVSYHVLKSQ